MTVEAKEGVWAPQALLLCVPCHGPVFPHKTFDIESDEWEYFKHPRELREGKGVTLCDKCEDPIQVQDNIAYENNVVLNLKAHGTEANMCQTGGMNSAGEVATEDGGWYLFTWNFDGDNQWLANRFDAEGEWMGEEYRFETPLTDTLIDHFLELDHIKKNDKS